MKVGIVLESLNNRQDFVCAVGSLDDAHSYYIIKEQLSPHILEVNLPILTIDQIYHFDGVLICFNLEHVKKAINSIRCDKIIYYMDNIDYVKDPDYLYNIRVLRDPRVKLITPSYTYSTILKNYINKDNIVVENYNIPEMLERV